MLILKITASQAHQAFYIFKPIRNETEAVVAQCSLSESILVGEIIGKSLSKRVLVSRTNQSLIAINTFLLHIEFICKNISEGR